MKLHHDPKIRRIEGSWLRPTPEAAAWLASAADEVVVADTTLESRRFAYIGLDQGVAGLVVGPESAATHVDCPAAVLVMRADQLAEAGRRIPALAA